MQRFSLHYLKLQCMFDFYLSLFLNLFEHIIFYTWKLREKSIALQQWNLRGNPTAVFSINLRSLCTNTGPVLWCALWHRACFHTCQNEQDFTSEYMALEFLQCKSILYLWPFAYTFNFTHAQPTASFKPLHNNWSCTIAYYLHRFLPYLKL